jgi:hypothetical protein
MNLRKRNIEFTSFDAQYNFVRILLEYILCIDSFFLSKIGLKYNVNFFFGFLSKPLPAANIFKSPVTNKKIEIKCSSGYPFGMAL